MSQNSKFGALAILGVIFAIGTLSGVGGTFYYLKQKHGPRHQQQRSERPISDIYRVQVDKMTSRLERSLELSEGQIPLIRAEIEKFGNAMRNVHEEMKPQFDALMQERSMAIEQHLSAEQLEAFREQKRQHRDRSKSWRDGKPGEGGPRPGGKPTSEPRACRDSACERKNC
jgi:hypothetical protein